MPAAIVSWAISLFAPMLSTLFDDYSIINNAFPYWCLDVSKVAFFNYIVYVRYTSSLDTKGHYRRCLPKYETLTRCIPAKVIITAIFLYKFLHVYELVFVKYL